MHRATEFISLVIRSLPDLKKDEIDFHLGHPSLLQKRIGTLARRPFQYLLSYISIETADKIINVVVKVKKTHGEMGLTITAPCDLLITDDSKFAIKSFKNPIPVCILIISSPHDVIPKKIRRNSAFHIINRNELGRKLPRILKELLTKYYEKYTV